MKLNHVHLRVRELGAAISWFEKVMQLRPGFHNERMATFSFGAMTLVFDASADDVSATIGFEKEWGVRTAYFKGPGALKFEIEGPVAK
jgi:catechol 2,3-dioxygenase-like lactoylglutathione lyase family enzyme